MKAILYAAKSTADPKGSIPTQLADARALVEREGGTVIAEYSDEAASGWSADRGPQLALAMEHATRTAPSSLVVQHTDRLARGDGKQARHLIELYLWAMKSAVTLRSVQDDSTCENLIMAAVMGERNAEDSRRKSLAVQAGKERRARRGKSHGGPRPYGYEYPGYGQPMRIVRAEAAIVRRVFAEYIAGRTLLDIGRGLQVDGVPTLRAKFWRHTTVSSILENAVYIGKVKHHGDLYDGEHEPIVTVDDWEKANAIRAARPKKGRGRPPKAHHLFRKGMLRCECGESMIARSTAWGGAYYTCGRRGEHGTDGCSMPHLRRADVDGAVYRYFEQIGLDLDATRQTIVEAQDRKLAEIRELRAAAEREAQQATEKLARVRRDYTEGRLDADDWRDFKRDLGAEKAAAESQVARLTDSERTVTESSALVDAEQEMLERLTEIRRAIAGEVASRDGVDAVRASLARLFERFVVRRDTPGRVHVELVEDVSLWIEPVVRGRIVDGEVLRPALKIDTPVAWPIFAGIPVLEK